MTSHLRLGVALLLAYVQAQAPTPGPQYFRYQRAVIKPQGTDGVACALLTPEVFAHAAPSLADLRLYAAGVELPYAVTLSEAASSSDFARILNLGTRSGHIVFDLQMPARAYTQVILDLAAQDFLATAKVTGLGAPGRPPTDLGTFTLFDLTSQHLSHSTTLNLQESTFPTLHLDLSLSAAPGTRAHASEATLVRAASVPPSREAQTLYTPVASTTTQPDPLHHRTLAIFELPPHVPVERVRFRLDPRFKFNFSRPVNVTARALGDAQAGNESIAGQIIRVDLPNDGRPIHDAQLTVPATLGMNMQRAATVQVSVDDGDDRPLPITSVELEMRERKLCFDVPAEPVTLFYGDATLHAPSYDFARLFSASAPVANAQLEPEQPNPHFKPRADERPYTERHPELLWIVLLFVIAILAVVAFRSTKQLRR